jgi:nondiscriminating aspartyl-tRNA synthetase
MCGVFGKVFETGSVFRAEPHATSRHLNEYTSLDFEMVIRKNFREIIAMECGVLLCIVRELTNKASYELEYITGSDEPLVLGQPLIKTVAEIKEILGTTGKDLTGEEEREISAYAKKVQNTELVFATHFHRDVRPFYSKLSNYLETTETFDLIFRGVEITSGGQRAETYAEYNEAMKAAGIQEEQFEGYLQTFKLGMPLHGGCAIGLERLTQKICGLDNVKKATLFPRDNNRLKP